jgi:monofunctional biosynthetic peptidoglycan transglycosylase
MARSFRFGSILSNRIVRRAALAVLALLLLPYVLTVLYVAVPPVSTLMLWRWVTGQRVERSWVPLEAIALTLPRAVIGAEDARYCSHWGVDFKEIQDAIADADDLSEARGGSTIPQQLAKNLFLWHGRSYVRKVLELPLALWLDLVLSKRRLMEIYLNVVEWGPTGEFGAEAASRRAFGKPARSLTAREAALLAASLPNPVTRDARRPGTGLNRLAGTYVTRAQQAQDGCVVRAARR